MMSVQNVPLRDGAIGVPPPPQIPHILVLFLLLVILVRWIPTHRDHLAEHLARLATPEPIHPPTHLIQLIRRLKPHIQDHALILLLLGQPLPPPRLPPIPVLPLPSRLNTHLQPRHRLPPHHIQPIRHLGPPRPPLPLPQPRRQRHALPRRRQQPHPLPRAPPLHRHPPGQPPRHRQRHHHRCLPINLTQPPRLIPQPHQPLLPPAPPTTLPPLNPNNNNRQLPKLIPHPLQIPRPKPRPRIIAPTHNLHALQPIRLLRKRPQIPIHHVPLPIHRPKQLRPGRVPLKRLQLRTHGVLGQLHERARVVVDAVDVGPVADVGGAQPRGGQAGLERGLVGRGGDGGLAVEGGGAAGGPERGRGCRGGGGVVEGVELAQRAEAAFEVVDDGARGVGLGVAVGREAGAPVDVVVDRGVGGGGVGEVGFLGVVSGGGMGWDRGGGGSGTWAFQKWVAR